MASVDWPGRDICEVVISDGGYRTVREGDNVLRTPMQSGLIRQKRINTRPRKVIAVRVDVPSDKEEEFLTFVDTHGSDWFNFRKPNSSAVADYRIVSGEVALDRAPDRMLVTRAGVTSWVSYLTGVVTLETYE